VSPWEFRDGEAVTEADGEPRAAAEPEPAAAPEGPRVAPAAPVDGERAPQRMLGHGANTELFHGYDAEAAERLVVSSSVSPMLVEQFRVLAATLHHAQNSEGLKTVMVTSAAVGDGKSLVATNLALTLSKSYKRRVLLIDADLRRPSLYKVFRVPGMIGLNEGLNATSDEMLPLIRISETLALLPAGRPVTDPMAGLSSARMKRIVDEAAAEFDWVILDTPPVGALADAALLSAMVGGSILVVRAGVTPFAAVDAAVAALGRDKVLGILLNAADPSDIHARAYYHHYYGHDAGDKKPDR
jgi:capsular exopolysaccharide synthesis family protein